MSDTHVLPPVSPSEARQIDHACDRFEAAWKAGQRPRLEEYLGTAAGLVRSALLGQLLLLDWDYRRRAGDEPRADDYRARFPGDAALVDDVGREMADSSVSTGVWSGGSASQITPWSGDDGPGLSGVTEAGADAGVPRYDLVREIGRGGIGKVFRGRDRHLGRELAVKVLRTAYRDKPDARRRFLAEARVGSQLQHPAIVPVYELGWFEDHRPYFTMKLVEGHTLAALLRDRSDPGRDLPRLLGVFEQVCQAMAYAHARGVVHRDLKPANVMVGTFGEVQVMDWGFAKVLGGDAGPAPEAGAADTVFVAGPDGVTKSGTLMGTPAYMPPEQARGQAGRIDARADVFALGAILCEILTGRPPYTGTTDEICAKAAEGDLAGAHARLDACGADAALRDLAKCCLVAERAARPTDAGAVARDVSAYLASAQERLRQAQLEQTAAEARAQAAGAKAQAERRARRLTLALAAALLCGTAVAVWQAVVATRAEQSARAAAAAETTAKQTAQAKEEETQAVLAFVQDRILAAARPEGQDGGLGHGVTLRQALEAALPHVDRSFASQPLTEARLRMALADSFFYLGDAKTAAAQNERVRALCLEHLGPDHPNTIGCLTNLANNYEALGRQDEAVRLREAALPLLRGRLGDDHPDTLKCMSNLAVSYTALGMYEEALRLDEQTLALRRKTLGPDHPDTLESMNNVAADHADLGQYAESAQLHEQTLSLRLDKLGENHPDTLTSMANLAACYVDLRRPGDALPLCERALAGRRAKLGDKHPDTLTSMTNLASCHDALGQRDEALKLAEEAVALLVAKHGPDHPDTLGGQYNLAWYYGRVGRHPEALQLHEATLARRKAQLGDDHPDTLTSMGGVAVSLVELHRGAEAVLIIDDCVRRAAGRAVNPKLIPGVLDLRLRHFEKAKDAAGCRATAALWEKLQRTDADSLYNAACFRAVTAAVLRAADTPSANEADAEAERAMAWLTKAVAAGYKNVASLTKDTDLDALRDRADFKALVAEIAGR